MSIEQCIADAIHNVVNYAKYDAKEKRMKRTGRWLVDGVLRNYIPKSDIRNGDANWLSRIYGAAYEMFRVHGLLSQTEKDSDQ